MLTLLRQKAVQESNVPEAIPSQEEFDASAELPVEMKTMLGGQLDPNLVNPHGVLDKKGIWPGFDGMPFRGSVPNLKKDDPERRQPETGMQVHTDVLALSNEAQLKRYNDILQVIANGAGVLRYEEKQYDEKISNWRILICWAEVYTYMPKGK